LEEARGPKVSIATKAPAVMISQGIDARAGLDMLAS